MQCAIAKCNLYFLRKLHTWKVDSWWSKGLRWDTFGCNSSPHRKGCLYPPAPCPHLKWLLVNCFWILTPYLGFGRQSWVHASCGQHWDRYGDHTEWDPMSNIERTGHKIFYLSTECFTVAAKLSGHPAADKLSDEKESVFSRPTCILHLSWDLFQCF